ncbi:ABC transporter substrate-binding protein [Streptomyces sp. HUAS MG47]|uniref:ABC transporter substrate-binding protein n=1 Tax=Streptomyces solicamelliae TaxID=3231716 RepID=UPI00387823AE
MNTQPIRIGALAPLTRPGWAEAGRHLLAGLELAVREVNAAGGIAGNPLELLVRDTAANPQKAEAAVDELAGSGVVAVVGEYHSVVARTVAARADALGVPFLCSSAVLDDLIDHPTNWVARLPPPQSQGWHLYADFLVSEGHTRVAAAVDPSAYWAAGTKILHNALTPHGGTLATLDMRGHTPNSVCDELLAQGATALLLLVGHPDPAGPIVKAVRTDPRLTELLIGAPAGQPELTEWAGLLGDDGTAVPFLRYLPAHLTPSGERIERTLRNDLKEAPSFVAFEGHDTITVLATALRTQGTTRSSLAASWPHLTVEGTRGTIRFTRTPPSNVWQWTCPPIQIADRDPASPDNFRTLHTS